MKKQFVIGVMVLCMVLGSTLGWAGAKNKKAVKEVELAVKYLVKQEDGKLREDCKQGFYHLVNAVLELAPQTKYPAEFNQKMVKANEMFKKYSIFHDNGRRLLIEAYKSINNGKEFKFPDFLSSIDDARKYGGHLMKLSLNELEAGYPDRSVKALMECAVMVTTPVVKKKH